MCVFFKLPLKVLDYKISFSRISFDTFTLQFGNFTHIPMIFDRGYIFPIVFKIFNKTIADVTVRQEKSE